MQDLLNSKEQRENEAHTLTYQSIDPIYDVDVSQSISILISCDSLFFLSHSSLTLLSLSLAVCHIRFEAAAVDK